MGIPKWIHKHYSGTVPGLEITGFPHVPDTQKWWRKPNSWTRVSNWKPKNCQAMDSLKLRFSNRKPRKFTGKYKYWGRFSTWEPKFSSPDCSITFGTIHCPLNWQNNVLERVATEIMEIHLDINISPLPQAKFIKWNCKMSLLKNVTIVFSVQAVDL